MTLGPLTYNLPQTKCIFQKLTLSVPKIQAALAKILVQELQAGVPILNYTVKKAENLSITSTVRSNKKSFRIKEFSVYPNYFFQG